MRFRKTILHVALVSTMGTSALLDTTDASASSLVIDGKYQLQILTTPTATRTTSYGGTETFFQTGSQSSGWNSSFTKGAIPGSAGFTSQGMTDNNTLVTVTAEFRDVAAPDWLLAVLGPDAGPGDKGSSVQDGFAGLITFDVVNGNIGNATSFNVDAMGSTFIGTLTQFIQNNDLSGFSGSIDAAGNMGFLPTGRLAAADGTSSGNVGRWNVNAGSGGLGDTVPAGTPWNAFTTGDVTNSVAGTVTGSACSGSAGNYTCTLVSGGRIGDDWGTAGDRDEYFEIWNTNLVRIGDASLVPVPAALWLFGSGLIGLLGVARRK